MNNRKNSQLLLKNTAQGGFTLIELLIAMVVASILGGAMVASFISQQRSAAIVRQVANMQQQLRGAFYILEHDIRLAGFKSPDISDIGVTDARRRSVDDGTLNVGGQPSVTVVHAWIPNSVVLDNDVNYTYRLSDDNGNGVWDLVREVDGGATQLVAENIEAMAIAFAYDNGSGDLARLNDGNPIWTVDSNNDGQLDTQIVFGDDDIPLAQPVSLNDIRMVRVWLLARAANAAPGFINNEIYQVGGQTLGPYQDGFRRRLMERTIAIRNSGLSG